MVWCSSFYRISYELGSGEVWITLLDGIRVKLQAKPFQVAIFEKETLLVNLNAGNLLLFEPMRLKPRWLFHLFAQVIDDKEGRIAVRFRWLGGAADCSAALRGLSEKNCKPKQMT